MFATLRTNISCVTIAPHENPDWKCNLLQFDANQGDTECAKNERLIMAMGSRLATPSSFR
jgi:hypothetical protein